jgi:hypothetical protein
VKPKSEATILREVLLAIGSRPDCLAIRRSVGTARDPTTGQCIRFGLEGEADVEAIVRGGRVVFLECKSATGTQRPAQLAFQRRVEALGATYRIIRSAEEAITAVEAAQCR